MSRTSVILIRATTLLAVLCAGASLAGCGGSTELISGPGPVVGIQSKTPHAGQKWVFSLLGGEPWGGFVRLSGYFGPEVSFGGCAERR
jgi:hypothetical protein